MEGDGTRVALLNIVSPRTAFVDATWEFQALNDISVQVRLSFTLPFQQQISARAMIITLLPATSFPQHPPTSMADCQRTAMGCQDLLRLSLGLARSAKAADTAKPASMDLSCCYPAIVTWCDGAARCAVVFVHRGGEDTR